MHLPSRDPPYAPGRRVFRARLPWKDDESLQMARHRAACALALGAEPSVPYDDSGEGVASVATYPSVMTVEEFEDFTFPDGKVELVRGEPRVMSAAGAPHAKVGSN